MYITLLFVYICALYPPEATRIFLLIRPEYIVHFVYRNLWLHHRISPTVQVALILLSVSPQFPLCFSMCVDLSVYTFIQPPVLYIHASAGIPAFLKHLLTSRNVRIIRDFWPRPVRVQRLLQQNVINCVCWSRHCAPSCTRGVFIYRRARVASVHDRDRHLLF